MSTPEDQLDRASDAEGESDADEVTAEASVESKNGAGGRAGLRGRRARRAARAEAGTETTTDDDASDDSSSSASSSSGSSSSGSSSSGSSSSGSTTLSSGEATQVSSDADAPAPPKRRRFGRGAGDSTGNGESGEATVVAPVPTPATKREPITYSTGADYPSGSTEAEAVLLDDSEELEDPYPSRSAMVAAPVYGERRLRQTISKVDLWSVTKLSLCFYISSMFVMIVALISLWLIADAAGIIKSVEDFLGDLLEAQDFKFLSGDVLRGTILVGLVIVALQVVLTVIAASFYNIFAELFGGLEITVKEEDDLR